MDPIALGKESSLADSRTKDDSVSRRLVTHRYRAHTGAEVDVAATNAERDSLVKKLEKISGKADFLPARYLADGLTRARAVCRITGPMGMGTGFLVGRGLIMTNNHVLANTSDAQASTAEFDFEQDKVKISVRLRPERLFITDAALDFTIVGCDDLLITEIQPIKLLRNPATIAEGENVSIVQHPSGRMKEIALRSNEVTSVQNKVIHYRTDTEPGSSGSPAFNDRWELVALHHAGWTEPGGQATNEGIRVASIVAKLKSQNFSGLSNSELGRELWESIDDTSPYLGFFDVVGLNARPEEIEVPDFVGSDNFADIGFWNIEHFNNNVAQDRIDRVTSVLARLSMDVLGLVEVEKGALRKACRALARRGLQYDFEIGDGPGSQDLAVLYDRETTTVQSREDILEKFSDQLDRRTAAGLTAFPRKPLIVECAIAEQGESKAVRFLMIVVHLKAFGDAQSRARRQLASTILVDMIRQIREVEDLPVVLGGDFNDKYHSDSLDPIADTPDLLTLTSDDATTDAISYVGLSHRSLIDHVVVSGDVDPDSLRNILGDDAAIVRLDRRISDFADAVSDHVPVVFRMVYRDKELTLPTKGVVVQVAQKGAGGNGAGKKSKKQVSALISDADVHLD